MSCRKHLIKVGWITAPLSVPVVHVSAWGDATAVDGNRHHLVHHALGELECGHLDELLVGGVFALELLDCNVFYATIYVILYSKHS